MLKQVCFFFTCLPQWGGDVGGQDEDDSPQLLRTRSDASFMRVQRRSKTHTARDLQRLRTHRFSINGHFYNHKVHKQNTHNSTPVNVSGCWHISRCRGAVLSCVGVPVLLLSFIIASCDLILLMCHREEKKRVTLCSCISLSDTISACCFWTESRYRVRDFLSALDFLWKMSRALKPRNPHWSVD